jgi:hypothetical protein
VFDEQGHAGESDKGEEHPEGAAAEVDERAGPGRGLGRQGEGVGGRGHGDEGGEGENKKGDPEAAF